MKRVFLIFFVVLLLSACAEEIVDEINISDSLKIRVQVLAKEYEGKGYFSYDPEDMRYGGSFILDASPDEPLSADEVFDFEELVVGEPRLCAPLGIWLDSKKSTPNLYMELICEDTISVSVENAGRNQLLLYHAYLDNEGENVSLGAEQEFTASGSIALSALPVLDLLQDGLWLSEAPVGNVHYINIQTSDGLGAPLVTARLKITTVEDVGLPIGVDRGLSTDFYGKNAELTRFCEIELVSFTYSDKYDF